MSVALRQRIFDELNALWLIDPHTHINAHQPASKNLADILGYHYYTELAHSAGMSRSRIEEPGLGPREKVRRLVEFLQPLENTIQYSWLIEMAQQLLGFSGDIVTLHNWQQLYDDAERQMSDAGWTQHVMNKSRLQAMFLTNDFDDPLMGFDR